VRAGARLKQAKRKERNVRIRHTNGVLSDQASSRSLALSRDAHPGYPVPAMSRRSTQSTIAPPTARPLKIVASGTLFVTHVLGVANFPEPGSAARAHSVAHSRGGAANVLLSILAQFPGVEALLVAPLGGNQEGKVVLDELRREGVSTKYSKIWGQAGVPSAWVLESGKAHLQSTQF
jgi:hypothetical protein